MNKQFKIYTFEEYTKPVKVKVSKKAERLSKKSQKLIMQHTNTVNELIQELSKDNPDVDFSDFIEDSFAFFTGEVIN